MSERIGRLAEIEKNWKVNPNNIALNDLEEATRLLVSEFVAGQNEKPPKEARMSLEAIKATLVTAVSDAVDQAYAQGVEDTKAASQPVDPVDPNIPVEPQPVPPDVDQIAKANYQAGIVDENRRVTALVEESIAGERATEDLLKEKLKLV